MNLPDVVAPYNQGPVTMVGGVLTNGPTATFNRPLAYIPLTPMSAGSSFAGFLADATPPHRWYVDFLKPIPSLEKLELSWWRFQKMESDPAAPYNIPNLSGPGTVGAVDENANVMLAFFCKNRRPE